MASLTMDDWSLKPSAPGTQVEHAAGTHSGAPHLNPESYPSQLFWLSVTFILLYLLVARSILPRIHEVLEKRQHHLAQDLDRAEELSQDAEEARSSYEKLQADARSKAQQFIQESQNSVVAMQEKKFAELDADLNDKLAKARDNIARQQSELQAKLTPVAREVTAQVIDKIIGVKPSEKHLGENLLVEQD